MRGLCWGYVRELRATATFLGKMWDETVTQVLKQVSDQIFRGDMND